MNREDEVEVFHLGEQLLQSRAGVRDQLAEMGSQVIRDHMPDQHRVFFAQRPFIIIGSMDAAGQPWASILAAPPGFISAPDAYRLRIGAVPGLSDPLHKSLVVGADIALLGIEQATRRRNRMNGTVVQLDKDGFDIQVKQSFGNCPKYIQVRKVGYCERASAHTAHDTTVLDDRARQIIARADTFFIASAHPDANHDATAAHGIDVSHRGGKPGFVRVDGDDSLTIPDFAGNRFFNTLGNIMLNPRVGLLFIDFGSGDVVYVAVLATVQFDGVEAYAGAQRLLQCKIQQVRQVRAAVALCWEVGVEMSPFLQPTGRWNAV